MNFLTKIFNSPEPECDCWFGHYNEKRKCQYCDRENPLPPNQVEKMNNDIAENLPCSGITIPIDQSYVGFKVLDARNANLGSY